MLIAGVTAALVVVPATTAFAAGLPSGPSVTGVTGLRPNATRVPFTISDRFKASVDVGTGNLNVSADLLDLPGVTGTVPIWASYNSLDTGSGTGGPASIDANGWAYNFAGAGSLSLQSDGSTIDYTDGTGAVWPFTLSGSVYTSPYGLKATLSGSSSSGWTLYFLQSSTTVTFDGGTGLPTSVVDRNSNTTSIDLLTSISSSAGTSSANTVALSYAPNTFTIGQGVNGYGAARQVQFVKDSSGYITSIVDATGATTWFTHVNGVVTKIVNADGAETDISYDSSRRVMEVDQLNTTTGSAGTSTTRFDYVSSTTTEVAGPDTSTGSSVPNVPHVTYTVDGNHMVTKAVDEMGRVRAATYNGNLDATSSTVGSGTTASTTTNTYGANNGMSLTASQVQGGATQSAAYGNTGAAKQYLPSSTTTDTADTTTYTYNGAGNMLTSQSPAVAANATVTRNGDGTVATAGAPNNGSNVTSYSYTNHQVTAITPVTGSSLGSKAFNYDSYGRLASQSDGAGRTTSYTYDNNDRVLTTSFSDSTPTVTNTFDAAGNLTRQVSGGGTITNSYDQLNHLISTVNTAGGGTEQFGYDAAGRQTTLTDTRGTSTYKYGSSGVLTSIVYPKAGGTQATNFATDSNGRQTDVWLQTNSTESVWAGWTHTSYDASGRVAEVKTELGPASSATVQMDVVYCYNTSGSGTSCATTSTGDRAKLQWSYNVLTHQTTRYTYDDSGRLITVAQTGGSAGNNTYSYGYDKNGNRTTATVTGSNPSSQTLTFNAANQITTSGYAYDGAGNMTASPGRTYTYNAAEQMTSTTAGGHTDSYTYAGASQNEVLSETGNGNTYKLTYGRTSPQGTAEILQYNVNGATAYVEQDPNVGQAVMLHTSSDIAALYIHDGIGNPVALLLDFHTTAFSETYDPYGLPTVTANDGGNGYRENPYAFKAGIQDRATGFVKFGNRWYNPVTGTWTQQDTLDSPLDPANANRYAYAGDDPINSIDPAGTNVWQALACGGGLIAIIIGDGIAVYLGLGGVFSSCQDAYAHVAACDAQVQQDRQSGARWLPGYVPPCQNPFSNQLYG